ncbi:MAG TPA: SRPBCC domain-containing protein [Steroidobacteraceae bacterium]|nr:SRPBCC domain-containing protein [Steroidobacteraceae bacterium]
MKVERKSDHAVSEASCKAATGKSLAEWFKALDKQGGIRIGRRMLGQWLMKELDIEPWWSATIVNEYEIARGDLAKDGKPKGYSICPTKSIKAKARDCFAAFATAEALDTWFGPKHDLDLRDGGHWRNADGNRATIKKVNTGKNIRLIAEDTGLTLPTPVEIKFEAQSGGKGDKCTVMVSIARLQTRAEADGYRRAWGEVLDKLKARLEAG